MNYKKLSIVIGMILAFIIFRYLEVDQIISIERLVENKERLIEFTSRHYFASIIIFLVLNVLLGSIGVPVYAVFTLAAGLIFGFFEGIIIALSASLLGGYISFFLSRYAFSNFFRKKYSHRLEKVEKRLEEKGFTYLLGLRLLPGFPYFATNVLAGLSPIKTTTYLYSTILGIIPSTVLFIYTGHVLRELDSIYQMLRFKYMWPVVLVGLMTLTAIVIRYKRKK